VNSHATSGSGACSTHATTIPAILGSSSLVTEFPTTSPSYPQPSEGPLWDSDDFFYDLCLITILCKYL